MWLNETTNHSINLRAVAALWPIWSAMVAQIRIAWWIFGLIDQNFWICVNIFVFRTKVRFSFKKLLRSSLFDGWIASSEMYYMNQENYRKMIIYSINIANGLINKNELCHGPFFRAKNIVASQTYLSLWSVDMFFLFAMYTSFEFQD